MCRQCGSGCNDRLSEEEYAEIDCLVCSATGKHHGKECEACGGNGSWRLTECPKRFVGWDLSDAINIASVASKGHLPVTGGVLDQSSWFFDLWTQIESDQHRIEAERIERLTNG